jgi:predicted unusual protein kinase regulating ubiquinone biosynthesis (AarF/ABC1/UbiB family)
VDELRARIGEELDYEHEASSQSAFHEAYRDHPFIRIPRVFPEHSSARVLTSELLFGRRFGELLEASDAERSRVGEVLYRFVFGSIFRLGALNGDPHPGNYLFGDDGRVGFIDFGCVKYFPDEMLARWKQIVRAHLEGEREAFRRLIVEAGFMRADTEIDADRLYRYFGYFYAPFHEDRSFRFTREYTQKSFRLIFAPDGEFAGFQKKLDMPRDFVFVNRLQWGVYSLLADLRAEANWHRIHRELLYGDPPSSELGAQDAQFFSRLRRAKQLGDAELMLAAGGLRVRAEA